VVLGNERPVSSGTVAVCFFDLELRLSGARVIPSTIPILKPPGSHIFATADC
jgi:hypothetical protein